MFQIWDDEAKNPAVLEHQQRIAKCLAELFQSQMLEDMRAVNSAATPRTDWETLDDISDLDGLRESLLVLRIEPAQNRQALESKRQ